MLSAIIASREQHARARADATSRAARARAQAARWRRSNIPTSLSAARRAAARGARQARRQRSRNHFDSPARKISREGKKLLHRLLNALMSRPPNFARACGRVSVGGHPDKRPDSRRGVGLSKDSPKARLGCLAPTTDRQPEAKPAHPALNGGRGLKQRRSGLLWSRRPSKGRHRRGLSILPAVRNGTSRSNPRQHLG